MKTLSSLALSSAMVLALVAGASAQTVRRVPDDAFYGLTTGRSVHVDRVPRGTTDTDGIVMGLRVPNGSRTPDLPAGR